MAMKSQESGNGCRWKEIVLMGYFRRAFTLIELMVVVAIIAVLVAILLPSLNRARSKARTSYCSANTRGMTTAVSMYVADYQRMIPFTQKITDSWTQVLNKAGNNLGITIKNRICPEAQDTASKDPAVQPWWGTARLAWGNTPETGSDPVTGLPLTSSYALNGYLYSGAPSDIQFISGDANAYGRRHRFPIMYKDSEIPVFADAIWRHVFPAPTDGPGANLETPGPNSYGNHPMSKMVMNRHNKTLNVSFLDGHADTLPLARLWFLSWSRDWAAPAKAPALPAQ
jgi:prepilin-type N-terminal cleavage/methylation domain-containing protein/prepilin-type processing-associated H-X9-DG protein